MEEIEESEKNSFNVYVGSATGVLKGIYFGTNTPILKNFCLEDDSTRSSSVAFLSWASEKNKNLLVGYSDGNLGFYSPKLRSFTKNLQLDVKSSVIGGFMVHEEEEKILTALENGKVNVYSPAMDKNLVEISAGQHLSVLRPLSVSSSVFATGGKENDLKIFDLNSENPLEPIFKARNVRHDFLDLRVPVWIQDLTFVNGLPEVVGTCSRHGQVRIYDTRVGQRPQIDFKPLDDEGLMAICDTGQSWQLVTGGNKGTTMSVDLRYPGKGKLVHKFSSASGSVRSIGFKNNSVVTCGLDRHLYIYNLYEKKALKKLYLKTRLTTVTMTEDFRLGSMKKKQIQEKTLEDQQEEKLEEDHLSSAENKNRSKRLKKSSDDD